MLNNTTLQGRIVATPELKQTVSQISVTSFTIAVERDYTPKGQDKTTDFIDIVAWRQTAEFICRYFAKGDLIIVQGAIQARSYEAKDGTKRKAVEVIVDKAHFCGAKSKDPVSDAIERIDKTAPNLNVEDEQSSMDDLPF
jgi:single-strand DNA-binding protein